MLNVYLCIQFCLNIKSFNKYLMQETFSSINYSMEINEMVKFDQ